LYANVLRHRSWSVEQGDDTVKFAILASVAALAISSSGALADYMDYDGGAGQLFDAPGPGGGSGPVPAVTSGF